MIDRRNAIGKQEDGKEGVSATKQKGVGELPIIVSSTAKAEPAVKQATEVGAEAKDEQAKAGLFNTGLKSTSMVVDKVKERVYKPPKPGSMKE